MKKVLTGAVILLLLLLGFLGYKNYTVAKENNVLKHDLDEEKKVLTKDLDEALANLSSKTTENDSLNVLLTEAQNKVVDLQQKIKKSRYASGALKEYRKQIEALKYEHMSLYFKLDSVARINDTLRVEIANTKTELNVVKQERETLVSQNKTMEDILEEAGELQVKGIAVQALKKSSGNFAPTNRYKKTDAFDVTFTVLKNPAAVAGEKHVYYIVKGPSGELLSPKDKFTFKGEEKTFTDGTSIQYNNKQITVNSKIAVNSKELDKGVYTLEVYTDDVFMGEQTIELKSSVLGVF